MVDKHLNFLNASSLRLALKSATAAALASLAFSILVSAYHLCTGSALRQPRSHSAHSTSTQQSGEGGSPARQFLADSNLTLNSFLDYCMNIDPAALNEFK